MLDFIPGCDIVINICYLLCGGISHGGCCVVPLGGLEGILCHDITWQGGMRMCIYVYIGVMFGVRCEVYGYTIVISDL